MVFWNFRQFTNRVLNFIRPKPRTIPLTVEQILGSQSGLQLVEQFNDLYYVSGLTRNLNWRGTPMIKNPCDLWMIIELPQRLQPRIIIETGTHCGGSASFLADMAAILGFSCTVVTIDYNPKWDFNPVEKGIISLVGYTTDPQIVSRVEKIVQETLQDKTRHVIVMLDADHSKANVTAELNIYSPFVTNGSYLIVEDTNVNGHPSFRNHGPGPWEAVEEFIKENSTFIIDHSCEQFLLTFNPSGWLQRVG